jgi:hypothetical protein
MDIVLPDFSDDEIVVKVALSATARELAAREEVADAKRELDRFVGDYLKRPAVAAALATANLPMDNIKAHVAKQITGEFVYTATPESLERRQAFKAIADQAMPPHLLPMKWSPDTCKCELHVIRDLSDPLKGKTQAYAVKRDDVFKELPIPDLFDAVKEENNRKNAFGAQLTALLPPGTEFEYKWSFDDGPAGSRKLIVDVKDLPLDSIESARGLVDLKEFKDKVVLLDG